MVGFFTLVSEELEVYLIPLFNIRSVRSPKSVGTQIPSPTVFGGLKSGQSGRNPIPCSAFLAFHQTVRGLLGVKEEKVRVQHLYLLVRHPHPPARRLSPSGEGGQERSRVFSILFIYLGLLTNFWSSHVYRGHPLGRSPSDNASETPRGINVLSSLSREPRPFSVGPGVWPCPR